VYVRYLQEFSSTDSDGNDGNDAEVGPANFLEDAYVSHNLNNVSNDDLGVEAESKMSVDALMAVLGLRGKSSLPWMNQYRHRLPVPAWTEGKSKSEVRSIFQQVHDAAASDYKNVPEDWTRLRLNWHQLVGIVAVLSKTFGAGIPAGILISDDVGVGKTAQSLGVIAMMMHYRQQEIDGRPLHGLAGTLAATLDLLLLI
jgi:hypothetical protein